MKIGENDKLLRTYNCLNIKLIGLKLRIFYYWVYTFSCRTRYLGNTTGVPVPINSGWGNYPSSPGMGSINWYLIPHFQYLEILPKEWAYRLVSWTWFRNILPFTSSLYSLKMKHNSNFGQTVGLLRFLELPKPNKIS